MPISERLEFDISDALKGVDSIDEALGKATTNFKVGIADALSLLAEISFDNVDASGITTAIDTAVQSADSTVEVEADAGTVTSSIDDAVSAVDATVPVEADASTITDSIDKAVGEADTQVNVEADGSALTASIDDAVAAADTSVEVQAVTDQLTAQIEDAVSGIDATVEVTADTSQAEQEIGQLGDTAAGATSSVDGLSTATTGLSAASAAATGDVAAAGAAVGRLGGPEAQAAVAGLTSVAGGLGVLIKGAIDSDTAVRKLDSSAGEFAAQINAIHIDGFGEDLTKLAQAAGQDDEKLRLAAARIFDVGNASGAAGPQIAASAEAILLMATRAASANPTLGQAGDIANTMTQAFATGRTRALIPFGITLNATQIQTEALAESGKVLVDELTAQDKITAGVTLATRQLGGSLKEDIVNGAQGAQVSLQSVEETLKNFLEDLGKPLLPGFLATLKAGEPAIEDLARILGDLGKATLPLVAAGLTDLAPALHVAADAVSVLLAPFLELAEQMDRHPLLARLVGAAANSLLGPLGAAGQAYQAVAGNAASAASGEETFIGTTAGAAAAAGLAAADVSAFSGALAESVQAQNAASKAANEHQASVDQILGPLSAATQATAADAQSSKALDDALNNVHKTQGKTGDSARTLANAHRQVEQAERGVTDAQDKLNRLQTEEIPKRLAEMTQKVADSEHSLEEAQRSEGEAQVKLNELRDVGIPRQLEQANRAVASASKASADAIRGEGDAQQKLNRLRDVDLPRQYADLTDKVTKANKSLQDADESLLSAQDDLNNVYRDYAEILDRADISAERTVLRHQDAVDRVTDLQTKLNELRTTPLGTNETQVDRDKEIVKTQRDIASAQLDVRDATLDSADAQKALVAAQGPDQQKKTADAIAKVEDAQSKQVEATKAATDAQRDLNDFQNGGAQRQLADAERAVSDAHDRVTDAARAEGDAQRALNDLQNGGIQKQLAEAQHAVEEAHRGTEKAATDAATAQKTLSDEQSGNGQIARDLETAQRGVADALDRVEQANDAVTSATSKQSGAQEENTNTFDLSTEAGIRNLAMLDTQVQNRENLITKLIAEQAPQDTINQLKQQEIDKLENLKRIHPELTALIDQYIAKLGQIKPEVATDIKLNADTAVTAIDQVTQKYKDLLTFIEQNPPKTGEPVIAGSSGGAFTPKMAGGPFDAFQTLLVGEAGPELVRFNSPGFVVNAQDTRSAFVGAPGFSNEQVQAITNAITRAVERQRPVTVVGVREDPIATATAVDARLGERATR